MSAPIVSVLPEPLKAWSPSSWQPVLLLLSQESISLSLYSVLPDVPYITVWSLSLHFMLNNKRAGLILLESVFLHFYKCLTLKAYISASFIANTLEFGQRLVQDIDCPYLAAHVIRMCFTSVASVQSHFRLYSKKCEFSTRHFKREYLRFPWSYSAQLSGGNPTCCQLSAFQISSQSAQAFARNRPRVRALSGPRK